MEPEPTDTSDDVDPRLSSSLGLLLSGIGLVLVVIGVSADEGGRSATVGMALVIFGGFIAVVLELRQRRP